PKQRRERSARSAASNKYARTASHVTVGQDTGIRAWKPPGITAGGAGPVRQVALSTRPDGVSVCLPCLHGVDRQTLPDTAPPCLSVWSPLRRPDRQTRACLTTRPSPRPFPPPRRALGDA